MAQEPLFPSQKELRFGWRYLLFQLIFLAYLLSLALGLLQIYVDNIGFNLLYFVINLVSVLVIFRRFYGRTLRDLPQSILRIPLYGLGGFFGIQILGIVIGNLIVRIDPGFFNVNDQSVEAMGQEAFYLTAIMTVGIAPIVEETLYRGVVFGSLYRRSPALAYVVSVCLFAFIHISEYVGLYPPRTLLLCFLQYVPAGLCLAASYQYSGTILTPILIHAAVNALGIAAMR